MIPDQRVASCAPVAVRLRRTLVVSGVGLLSMLWTSSAAAYPQGPETLDTGIWAADFSLPPISGAQQWVEQFPGDVTSQVNTMTSSDSASDPFANAGDLHSGSPSDADWVVPYDTVNTNETYLGDPLDYGVGTAHVGLDLGPVSGLSSLDPVDAYWADSSGSPIMQLPSIGFAPSPAQLDAGPFHYAIVYAVVSNGSTSAGEWFEVPYTGAVPHIQLTAGNEPLTLTNPGFFLSPTEIPLDNLNFDNLPPPGNGGSMFTPLPSYDGSSIAADGGTTLQLPEPNSLVLAALAALCTLFGYRRCRRAS